MDRKLSKVVNQILECPEYNWNLDDLADSSLMSRASFAKRFREISQLTPFEFITSVRIMKASNLLAQSNYLISDIGMMCGCNSESPFNKIFTKKIGTTPGTWQRFVRKNNNEKLNIQGLH